MVFRRVLGVIVGVLAGASLLTGCRFPTELFFAPDTLPPSQLVTPRPTATSQPGQDDPALTIEPTSLPCSYSPDEQNLPDLTARLQDQIALAGLGDVDAMAVAYGENCVDILTNQIISFIPMETDFYFNVPVEDSQNATACGNAAISLLNVIEMLPPEQIPGANPGNFTIVFQDERSMSRLSTSLTDARQARDRGLRGSAFFEFLGGG